MKSQSLALSKNMIALLEKQGITTATPVQREIIPAIKQGRDVLAQSETGSGKTLSFAIPILEKLNRRDGLQVLVLVPTRELCIQVAGEFMRFSQGKHLGIVPVYGGTSINTQITRVRSANILVATPGRLLDLIQRRAVSLLSISTLVLDEADRMLDMGFIKDIERILSHVPKQRQTMLFSATVPDEITRMSKKYLNDPVHVRFASTVQAGLLEQAYYKTPQDTKLPLLIELLNNDRQLTIIFCNRKHITVKLARMLSSAGIDARCLNGNMSQSQRERVTNDFRRNRFSVLVATDVAARGLHIDDVTHVVNYEIPPDVESYTHRIGRTARAGKSGTAISLVTRDDERYFRNILREHNAIILRAPDHSPMKDTPRQPSRERVYDPRPFVSEKRKPRKQFRRKAQSF